MANPERQAKLRGNVRRLCQVSVCSQIDVIRECLNEIMRAQQRAGPGGSMIIREVNQYLDEIEAEGK